MSRNIIVRDRDWEKIVQAIYESVKRLEAELGCSIHVHNEGNQFYIIIPTEEFVNAMVRKVRQNMNQNVLKRLDIQGTAVTNYMVLRLTVKK